MQAVLFSGTFEFAPSFVKLILFYPFLSKTSPNAESGVSQSMVKKLSTDLKGL